MLEKTGERSYETIAVIFCMRFALYQNVFYSGTHIAVTSCPSESWKDFLNIHLFISMFDILSAVNEYNKNRTMDYQKLVATMQLTCLHTPPKNARHPEKHTILLTLAEKKSM